MDRRIKILAAYHKKDKLFKDEIVTPIHLGRAAVLKKEDKTEDDEWLLRSMIGDDTGENISEKNPYYNEMTALYWAWKNYGQLGSPDFIGLVHYRRHFMLTGGSRPVYESVSAPDDYVSSFLQYSPDRLERLLREYDFIAPMPQTPMFGRTVFEHYHDSHKIAELEKALDIIKEKYPAMRRAAEAYLHHNKAYYYNMFVMKRDDFFLYAEFMFDILGYFEKEAAGEKRRLYLSERLTGVYIAYLEQCGRKGKCLPVSYIKGITKIPVLSAADENYAVPLYVALASVMEHAGAGSYYQFKIMVPAGFGTEAEDTLRQICVQYQDCEMEFIGMGEAFRDVNMSISHITSPTYYRLLAAERLPDIDKCIYLDPDILVCDDISKLFAVNVDDYYVGGVKAAWYHSQKAEAEEYCARNRLPSMSSYINAGVLVMNLKRMREEGVSDRFLGLAHDSFSSQDQDIINIACYGNIRFMPFQYNAMTKYRNWKPEEYACAYSAEEFREAWAHPVVIHYADKAKPWNDIGSPMAELWWNMLLKTPVWKDMCEEKKDVVYRHLFAPGMERKEIEQLKKTVEGLMRSPSFRIGRMVTFVPRKLAGGMKCLRQMGLRYTVEHACRKIMGKA